MIDGWTPGIGDLSALGWLTVAAYLFAALVCMRASGRDRRSTGLWLGLAATLFLLAVNKQLDLQSLLAAVGRQIALANGWYGQRRIIQLEIVLAILACAGAVALATLIVVRRRTAGLKIATLGCVALCGFVAIRAASLHRIDLFLDSRLFALSWNHLLELGGIAIVSLGAAQANVTNRPGRPTGRLGKRRAR